MRKIDEIAPEITKIRLLFRVSNYIEFYDEERVQMCFLKFPKAL